MGGLRKFWAGTAVVLAGMGVVAAMAPAAGAADGAPPAGFYEMKDTTTFASIGYGALVWNGKAVRAGAVVNSGLPKGNYQVNLVYWSTADIMHPHVRHVCTLRVDDTGYGWCARNLHAAGLNRPSVNAIAVTITKPGSPVTDPGAVAIVRFG